MVDHPRMARAVGGPREIVGAVATPHRIDDIAGIAHPDLNRRRRTAVPEVVFAEGKTAEQQATGTFRLLADAEAAVHGIPAERVHWTPWQRSTLPRTTVLVPVGPPGAEQEIIIKVATGPGGVRTAKPELADAQRIAQALGWLVRRVCEAALSAYHRRVEP